MTNPTLERAARALADHFGCEWETMREADRETITGYCRAVLMAVRSVEPDLWHRANNHAWQNDKSTVDHAPESVWPLMIDTILEPTPTPNADGEK